MMIDRMLARFKIQTKDIAFIVPFVVSISRSRSFRYLCVEFAAVSKGHVQRCAPVTERVQGCVFGMGSFLQNTTEEARSNLKKQIDTQSELAAVRAFRLRIRMKASLKSKAPLREPKPSARGLISFWTQYQQELSVRQGLDEDLAKLVRSQTDLLNYATSARENLAAERNQGHIASAGCREAHARRKCYCQAGCRL